MSLVAKIKAILLPQASTLIPLWFPDGKYSGRKQYVAINPSRYDANLGSFTINLDKGKGHDFATKDDFDLIDLFALAHNMSNTEAIIELAHQLSISDISNSVAISNKEISLTPKGSPQANIPQKPFNIARLYHKRLGKPSMVHVYRNEKNQVIGYVCRFDSAFGKEVLAFTYFEWDGKLGWHWSEKGWNGTKPIYGVEKLRKRQKAKILIVEGEKTCDAAQRLFPDMICLSWRGGTGNVTYVDLSPLKDRDVIIWPDNDDHGILAAKHIASSIPNAIIIEPPKWKFVGWDLADAEKEHIPKKKLYEYIANATAAHSPLSPTGSSPEVRQPVL
jgi:5S rRNA maturation endonuclease (ribonuclease M5)